MLLEKPNVKSRVGLPRKIFRRKESCANTDLEATKAFAKVFIWSSLVY